jgi:hypothetical protein
MTDEKPLPTSVILVLIEWGGKKPPSTFYNRLHEYGLYSRRGADSSGEMSLLEWRATRHGRWKTSEHRGLVTQEGAIVVSSRTLANDIAAWAQEYGASVVQISSMVIEDFTMEERDQAQFQKLKQSVAKRGPKRLDDRGMYVITCLDCCVSYDVQLDSLPFHCMGDGQSGGCGGSNIQSRLGLRSVFQPYPVEQDDRFGAPRLAWWKRTRFASEQFEVPVILEPNSERLIPVPRETVPQVDEPTLVELPDGLRGEMRDWIVWMHVMDVAWCVTRYSEKRRLENRVMTLNAYAVSGGDNYYSFVAPGVGAVDILDLCSVDGGLSRFL